MFWKCKGRVEWMGNEAIVLKDCVIASQPNYTAVSSVIWAI